MIARTRWTDRELSRLSELGRQGLTSAEIRDAFNETRGCRPRSYRAIVRQLRVQRVPFRKRAEFWTNDEILLVKALVGMPVRAIQDALQVECETQRSVYSIALRIRSMGFESSMVDETRWITSYRAAYFLGITPTLVYNMLARGEMQCRRFGPGHQRVFVRPEWIDEAIDRVPMRFNSDGMPRGRFRSRVETRQREGCFLNVSEAADVIGIHRATVNRACLLGQLRADCVRHGKERGRPRWWIRRADAIAFRNAIERQAA